MPHRIVPRHPGLERLHGDLCSRFPQRPEPAGAVHLAGPLRGTRPGVVGAAVRRPRNDHEEAQVLSRVEEEVRAVGPERGVVRLSRLAVFPEPLQVARRMFPVVVESAAADLPAAGIDLQFGEALHAAVELVEPCPQESAAREVLPIVGVGKEVLRLSAAPVLVLEEVLEDIRIAQVVRFQEDPVPAVEFMTVVESPAIPLPGLAFFGSLFRVVAVPHVIQVQGPPAVPRHVVPVHVLPEPEAAFRAIVEVRCAENVPGNVKAIAGQREHPHLRALTQQESEPEIVREIAHEIRGVEDRDRPKVSDHVAPLHALSRHHPDVLPPEMVVMAVRDIGAGGEHGVLENEHVRADGRSAVGLDVKGGHVTDGVHGHPRAGCEIVRDAIGRDVRILPPEFHPPLRLGPSRARVEARPVRVELFAAATHHDVPRGVHPARTAILRHQPGSRREGVRAVARQENHGFRVCPGLPGQRQGHHEGHAPAHRTRPPAASGLPAVNPVPRS